MTGALTSFGRNLWKGVQKEGKVTLLTVIPSKWVSPEPGLALFVLESLLLFMHGTPYFGVHYSVTNYCRKKFFCRAKWLHFYLCTKPLIFLNVGSPCRSGTTYHTPLPKHTLRCISGSNVNLSKKRQVLFLSLDSREMFLCHQTGK